MTQPTKDLFDDTTMTFGEHLEVLRVHLIRALLGTTLVAILCLYGGNHIVDFVRRPIDRALRDYSHGQYKDDADVVKAAGNNFWSRLAASTRSGWNSLWRKVAGPSEEEVKVDQEKAAHPDQIVVNVDAQQLASALHQALPDQFPAPAQPAETPAVAPPKNPPAGTEAPPVEPPPDAPAKIRLTLQAAEFQQFQTVVEQSQRAVTLRVEEAFMTYMKVSLIASVVLSSPWIFFQAWQFVAAGLYPHEQRYVYLYGTMSLVLFLTGAAFCFYVVFPFVLQFLLEYNRYLGITPQIRLSEWIGFAVMLPLMFGISFQLPLVMLFLERISIFQVEQYTQQRRMAILVMAILSAILTPAEPISMLLMLFPLLILYELGIKLCKWLPAQSPFEEQPA